MGCRVSHVWVHISVGNGLYLFLSPFVWRLLWLQNIILMSLYVYYIDSLYIYIDRSAQALKQSSESNKLQQFSAELSHLYTFVVFYFCYSGVLKNFWFYTQTQTYQLYYQNNLRGALNLKTEPMLSLLIMFEVAVLEKILMATYFFYRIYFLSFRPRMSRRRVCLRTCVSWPP